MSVQAHAERQLGGSLAVRRGRSPAFGFVVKLCSEPVGAISLGLILLILIAAIFAEGIAPYRAIAVSSDTFEGPSLTHLMGTDDLGRDVFSRVIFGARTSLYVGLVSVVLGVGLGGMIGLVSGFLGGYVDLAVQRVVDAMLAIPGIVLAMALLSVLGPSTTNALLAIAIAFVPGTSRVIRASVLSVKESMYITAAETIGAPTMRIMVRHVLPNVMAPILILASAYLGAAILIEAGLSFLGLATQPPNPSWGLMLSGTGRQYMEQAPWLAIFPGLAISLTVLSFNLLGDVLRDLLDPRLRGSR
ncbi:MAG: ABC transporter permease [Chloroflexota bacterium]